MSWLGGSISSLTGQLSTLTKDILTEGTEEVSDHATQLRLANEKITEYETLLSSVRGESERLKKIIHELEEKAEGSELQINSISQQYRTLLGEKEKEINALKHEVEQQHQQLLKSTTESHHDRQTDSATGYHGGFASDDLDFGDNIGLQHEINRLTQEVRRLKGECKRWKTAANQTNTQQNEQDTAGANNNEQEVLQLRDKLKELSQQLRNDKQQHQEEIASLQDVHSHKIIMLRSKLKSEIDEQAETIEVLQKQLSNVLPSDSDSGETSRQLTTLDTQDDRGDMTDKLSLLKQEVETLKSERNDFLQQIGSLSSQMQSYQADSESAQEKSIQRIQQLEQNLKDRDEELHSLRTEYEKQRELRTSVEVLEKEQEAVAAETDKIVKDIGDHQHQQLTADIMDTLERENLVLKKKNVELQEQVTLLEKAVHTATQARHQADSQAEQDSSISADDKSGHITHQDDLINQLKQKLQEYESKAEQFEVVKSDLEQEKEALENVLVKLRGQLQEMKDADIKSSEDMEALTAELKSGRAVIENLREVVQEKDDEIAELMLEKDQLHEHCQELTNQQNQVQYNKDAILTEDLSKLKQTLGEREVTLQTLQSEKDEIKSSLNQAKNYIEEKDNMITSLVLDKEKLEKSLCDHQDLKEEMKTIKQTFEDLQVEKKSLEESVLELSTVQQQVQEKESLLAEMTLEKAELESGLEELDNQHQEATEHLMKIRADLVKELEDVKGELTKSQGEVKNLKEELTQVKNLTEDSPGGSKEELESIKQQLKSKEEMVAGLKQTVQEMKTQVRGKDEDSSHINLMKELQVLKGELEVQTDLRRSLEEQMEDLEWKYQEREGQITSLQQQLVSLREWEGTDEVEDDAELFSLRDKNSHLLSELQNLEAVQTELVDLKNENSQLISDLYKMKESQEKVTSQNENNSELFNDVKKFKELSSDLQNSCDSKDIEINDLKQKLQTGALAVNDLHMDIEDLEETLTKSEKSVAEKVDKIKVLRTSNNELKNKVSDLEETVEKLSRVNDSLQQERLSEQATAVNKEIETLQQQSNYQVAEIQKHQSEMSVITDKNKQLQSDIDKLDKEKIRMTDVIQTLEQQEKETRDLLEAQIESLNSEKNLLEKEFVQAQYSLQAQVKNLENYIAELKQEREEDSSTVEQRYQTLLQKCHEKDVQISNLQAEANQLNSDVDDMKKMVDSAILDKSQLTDLLREKEDEIANLNQNNSHMKETLKDQAVLLESMESVKENWHSSRAENTRLKEQLESVQHSMEDAKTETNVEHSREITDLKSELAASRQRATELEQEVVQLASRVKLEDERVMELQNNTSQLREDVARYQQVISEHEQNISKLNQQIEQNRRILDNKEQLIANQDRKMVILEQEVSESQQELNNLKVKLEQATASVEENKQYLINSTSPHRKSDLESQIINNHSSIERGTDCKADLIESVIEKASSQTVSGVYNGGMENKDDSWDEKEDDGEGFIEKMEQFQNVIRGKDKIIQELQTNNSSLLKMMEKGVQGDRSLLDVHKLENEIKALKLEKEQILTVMTEKSRESSSLKSEVHRLMNVISAEKGALQKLQSDNMELKQKREDPNEDMHREALQNLSRLVRDKDLEIEALTQKNQTLLQVLQESSTGGADVSGLVQDKDNLTKQLANLQAEREQMMIYLNQKHEESLAYHNEIQRLRALINSESEKFSQIQQDYDSLRPQFEDNKQALLKAQNDLINYKQKYTELEVKHGELLQQANASETVDIASFNSKVGEVKMLEERQKEMVDTVREKDSKIQILRQQSVEFEEILNAKDSEISALKKQVDSFTFQCSGLKSELEHTCKERSALQQQLNEHLGELQLLKDSNSQLTLTLQQREFELHNSQEKAQTLTAMVHDQEKGGVQQEHVDKLMKENEVAMNHAAQIQQERDQAMMAVRQRQEEVEQLHKQIYKLKEHEEKGQRELQRLRTHLIQIEEGYTKEALESEEREKTLRNKLIMAEEKLITSSSIVQNASEQASLQVDSLQQQLVAIASQRDQAYLQTASLQEQCSQYATSLANLQMVLEQFQQEKESAIAVEVERYQRENTALKQHTTEVEANLSTIKEKLEEAEDGLEAAARLSEQLDRKEEALSALKEEVQLRENALKIAEEEIHKLTSIREAKVDKIIIKNLLLGYFTTPKNQQHEVLKTIGGVLGFTPDNYIKINEQHSKSWVPGFLRFGGGPQSNSPSPATTPTHQSVGRRHTFSSTPKTDRSFSELFVNFLEKESTPPPSALKLPAEEMAADVQRHKDKPAYNPFTAPRHVSIPSQTSSDPGGGGQTSHILMSSGQMSPTLPMFAPVSYSGSSGPNSNSSSAILKDVLSSR